MPHSIFMSTHFSRFAVWMYCTVSICDAGCFYLILVKCVDEQSAFSYGWSKPYLKQQRHWNFPVTRMFKFHGLCLLLRWIENYFQLWDSIFLQAVSLYPRLRQNVANCSLPKFLYGESFILCAWQLARNYTNLFAQTVLHWNKFLSVYSHTYVGLVEKQGEEEMKWARKRGKCLAKQDRAVVIMAAFITRQAAMRGRSLVSCGRYRESIFTLSSTQLPGIRDLTPPAGSCLGFSFWSWRRGYCNGDCTVTSLKMHIWTALKMTVFWAVTPCSLVEVNWRFRGAYCLHLHGDPWFIRLPDIIRVVKSGVCQPGYKKRIGKRSRS
jgi:hypothetical protein